MSSLYKATPRQIKEFTINCLQAGLVPFMTSSPGMGKSSIVRAIAKEFNLYLIDHRLSTSDPTDLTGLPFFNEGRAEFMPFREMFPIEGDTIPKGYDGWLVFLDEFNSARKETQAAAYKLILDRMVGQKHLHQDVAIVCAGNLASDRAIVNNLSTAMQSRLVHLEMEISHQEWMEDVAIKQNFDPRIIAFLSQWKDKLMDFRPEHEEKTFCCPRTWEFVNKLLHVVEPTEKTAVLFAGTITSGVAAEFIQFCKIYKNMLTLNDILRSPETVTIPEDISTRWAVTSMLMAEANEQNIDKILKFVDRMSLDFKILFFRAALIRIPNLRTNPNFLQSVSQFSEYLFG